MQFSLVDYFKVIMGLFLIFAVGLYQTYLSASLSQIKNQIMLCHVYGIQFRSFLIDIFWPQAKSNIYFLLSLIYLISTNEFAMIKASGAQLQTVGTLTEMYLNSYRMNQAYLLSAFSLMTWLIVIFILRSAVLLIENLDFEIDGFNLKIDRLDLSGHKVSAIMGRSGLG